MHCVRCGGEVPEGSQACPGCGLKLKPTPPTPIQQVMPPPPAGQGATPQDAAGAPPEYHYQGTPPEPVETTPQYPPQGQYLPPGDASAPPPTVPYISPGEMPPPGQYPYGPPPVNPYGRAGKEKQPGSGGDRRLVIILVVALIVILGAVAGLYFALKKTAPTGPEAAVIKLFETLPSGNAEAIKGLYAPDSQPTAAQLSALSAQMATAPGAKIGGVKVKTLTQTPTDATVQILDYTVTVTAGGQSIKMNMSSVLSGVKFVMQVKKVNGEWLLVAPNGSVPDV